MTARKVVDFTLNLLFIEFEVVAFILMLACNGTKIFMFYTDLSNIFALVVAIIYFAYQTLELFNVTHNIPQKLVAIRYFSVCGLFVTFVVVGAVLAPYFGLWGYVFLYFKRAMLFTHFLCPVTLICAFVIVERENYFNPIIALCAVLPTFVYGIIAIFLNCIKVWAGPYPFFFVYYNGAILTLVWVVGLLAVVYVLNLILFFANGGKVAGKKRYILTKAI